MLKNASQETIDYLTQIEELCSLVIPDYKTTYTKPPWETDVFAKTGAIIVPPLSMPKTTSLF